MMIAEVFFRAFLTVVVFFILFRRYYSIFFSVSYSVFNSLLSHNGHVAETCRALKKQLVSGTEKFTVNIEKWKRGPEISPRSFSRSLSSF